jgi:ABC-type Fe3+/spermidine/putrescine transport system ATPase subunit
MLETAQQPSAAGLGGVDGVVQEVAYLGSVTRYVVESDGGQTLTVVRQNLETSAGEALAARGRRVRLAWREQDASPLGCGDGASEQDTSEQEDGKG